MSTKIGTPLAPKMVAWVWFAVAAGFSLVCGWKALQGQIDWTLSVVSAGIALLIYLEPRLRRREFETVQVDDVGILRVEGSVQEEVRWDFGHGGQNYNYQRGPLSRGRLLRPSG